MQMLRVSYLLPITVEVIICDKPLALLINSKLNMRKIIIRLWVEKNWANEPA